LREFVIFGKRKNATNDSIFHLQAFYMQAFNKLKVIELASVLAGPAVGQFFAELGAEVIKVENREAGGDVTRTWRSPGEPTDDRSAYFSSVNWGKKSVAVNLSGAEGKKTLYRLIVDADIVIVSFKPGDAEKLGADFETLRRMNNRLLYGEITGYGSTDPRVGYDAVIQAEAGFMSLNGEPGGQPLKMPVALMDVLAAHHLKEGLLVGLVERERTGSGMRVSVSLFDAAIASLANQATNWLVGKSNPQRQGSLHPNIAPYGEVLTSRDGHDILPAIGNDRQFQSLLRVLRLDHIVGDPRFITNEDRVQNRAVLVAILTQAASAMDSEEIMAGIRRHLVPAGLISDVRAALQTSHAKDLRLTADGLEGLRTFIARFDNEWHSQAIPSGPPHFGQHTSELLD
jgi:crotonobetainyl-CoA:carnitine CoA-transferase CaiB-like acyl-CoA transferase